MTIDIIAKSVLTFIQEDYKNSIIAGGAIRDTYLELEPKDWDIFVPVSGKKSINTLLAKVHKEFGPPSIEDKTGDYESTAVNSVNYLELEGKKIEIIGRNEPDDEDFPTEVIRDFDFGVNMAYFDGRSFDYDNEYFENDMRNGYISLINLREMHELPKSIRRFESINKKFYDAGKGKWEFRAPCLSINKEKTETKKSTYDILSTYVGINREPIRRRNIPVEPNFNPWDQPLVQVQADDNF